MDVSAYGYSPANSPSGRAGQAGRLGQPLPRARTPGTGAGETGFDRLLDSLTQGVGPEEVAAASLDGDSSDPELHFSRHAAARLESRGIELSPEDLDEISDAMDRLADKDARESLLLMGDNAFIIGVPKRTVITAMTRQEAVGSIFTNIDSTVVVR